MKGLFTVQGIIKGNDLTGQVLDSEVINLDKNYQYFDKESWHVIMVKGMFLSF